MENDCSRVNGANPHQTEGHASASTANLPMRMESGSEDIKLFRTLRSRAEDLMSSISNDLRPFLHHLDEVTFIRKPGSPSEPEDVNVTTTCSCLMALALTKRLEEIYSPNRKGELGLKTTKERLIMAFKRVLQAPWMSSGLTQNNSFTTTLVLRAWGYLVESGHLSIDDIKDFDSKRWCMRLGIRDPKSLAKKLNSRRGPLLQFLYLSLSDRTRTEIANALKNSSGAPLPKPALDALAFDLDRIVHGPWMYEPGRFPSRRLSPETRKATRKPPTGYALSRLHHQLLIEMLPDEFSSASQRSLEGIAKELGSDPSNFSINQYPPAASVVYWFIDAADRSRFELPGKYWQQICRWASEEFYRQQSLVVSDTEAMMDPISLAMAACTCRRLRSIANQPRSTSIKDSFKGLPSEVELTDSILKVVPKQTRTGIWPKYFPMFHYREGGTNFCFTFEMLEAVLVEFATGENSLMRKREFVNSLQGALDWCADNRKEFKEGGNLYCGWTSGHDVGTLKQDQPESWATAVVHMFLWELQHALSTAIHVGLLDKYRAKVPDGNMVRWDELLDGDVQMRSHPASTVKTVLEREIIGMTLLSPEDIKKARALASILNNPRPRSVSAYIKGKLSGKTRKLIAQRYDRRNEPKIQLALAEDLNRLIKSESFHADIRSFLKNLPDYSNTMQAVPEVDRNVPYLNRVLLQEEYGKELSNAQLTGHARQFVRLSHERLKGRRSVLLFGPPGTSKTTLVRAFAAELRWPLIEIEPSDFLTAGLENIYRRAKEIFDDLQDLSGVVVFFDEMDALVRTRDDQSHPLDVMSRFLTTSMLPKLAALHESGRVVFFFATNYQGEFDSAIKRPGRFDILLCVWPPTWERKFQAMGKLLGGHRKEQDVTLLQQMLRRLVSQTKPEERQILDLLTFNEAKSFIESLSAGQDLLAAVRSLSSSDFSAKLREFEQCIILRRDQASYQRYNNERAISQLQ